MLPITIESSSKGFPSLITGIFPDVAVLPQEILCISRITVRSPKISVRKLFSIIISPGVPFNQLCRQHDGMYIYGTSSQIWIPIADTLRNLAIHDS